MPWHGSSIMDQKIEFVIRAKHEQIPFSQLCKKYGISRPTGYLWLKRYEAAGTVTGLQERSRRPQHSPSQTSESLVEAITALRKKHSWGARKLKVLLAKQGYRISEATINRVLAREGLLAAERPQPATKRFAREECNELVQMDFKGEYQVKEGSCYPLSLLDDHSRYLLGLWPLAHPSGAEVKAVLEPFFQSNGVPEAMLLDHGTPWWSTSNGYGLTRLSVWLLQQDIRLHFSRIRHPQTQGKVERMHRSLKERTRHEGLPETLSEWSRWAETFRSEYNEIRPHEAWEIRTPAEVYKPVNLHAYCEHPRPWDYGDAPTAQLNSSGCLYFRGHQYFVCEALANERVRVEALDELLVIGFRSATIREINLRTGETVPVTLSSNLK